MSRSTPVWRAILWTERFLPTPAENPPQRSNDATTEARSRRSRFAVLLMFAVSMILPPLVRDRPMLARMWPMWRPMIEQFVLLLAIVVGLAAVLSGVVTWQRERRKHA